MRNMYYKVICVDAVSDKWQVLVYDENRRIVDCEFCASSDMWLGYCRGLDLCGCKEI